VALYVLMNFICDISIPYFVPKYLVQLGELKPVKHKPCHLTLLVTKGKQEFYPVRDDNNQFT
jgi:hypothetical protein